MMASNMAQKRAAKANRRKAAVAEKRKLEINGSLAAQVARAAQLPIQHCLLSGNLRDAGMANLILARGASPYRLMIGGFLIDTLGFGIKDILFETAGQEAFDDLLDRLEETGTVENVDPAYARKLLREVTAWAASNGMAPHRDFAVVERMFGDVDADACGTTFTFVGDGELTSIPGLDGSRIPLTMDRLRRAAEKLGKVVARERERVEELEQMECEGSVGGISEA
jgi:hypothetical protein